MIKIGILGCAEIAFRRFLPALMENKDFECVCIAEEYDKSKLFLFSQISLLFYSSTLNHYCHFPPFSGKFLHLT